MKQIVRVGKSIGKILYWKCRYGSRVRTSWIQGFDKVSLELSGTGQVQLGEKIQNRGSLYLICEGNGRLEIGAHVFCNTNVCITSLGHVSIGEYSKLGNNLVVVDHDHNFKTQDGEYLIGDVTIGKRVWIGANCTILKGAHIGDDCVIAAGSVVKGDIPAGTVFCQKRENKQAAARERR